MRKKKNPQQAETETTTDNETQPTAETPTAAAKTEEEKEVENKFVAEKCSKYLLPFQQCIQTSNHHNYYYFVHLYVFEEQLKDILKDFSNATSKYPTIIDGTTTDDSRILTMELWKDILRDHKDYDGNTKYDTTQFQSPLQVYNDYLRQQQQQQQQNLKHEHILHEPKLRSIYATLPKTKMVTSRQANHDTIEIELHQVYAMDQNGNLCSYDFVKTNEEEQKQPEGRMATTPNNIHIFDVNIVPGFTETISIYCIYKPKEQPPVQDDDQQPPEEEEPYIYALTNIRKPSI